MKMKRRVLGLMLAGLMVVPATGAFAATQEVGGNDTTSHEAQVDITGTVRTKDDLVEDGKISVELPTAIAFVVDGKGGFTGAQMNVDNKSQCGIEVSLDQFITTTMGEGMDLVDVDSINEDTLRGHVGLYLEGNVGGTTNTIKLLKSGAEYKNGEKRILTVGEGQSGIISLKGESGKAENGNVDNGATFEGKLIYKVAKDNK